MSLGCVEKEKNSPKFRVSGAPRPPAVRAPGARRLCGRPRNLVRHSRRVLGYSPGVLVRGCMCAAHVHGIPGAPAAGHAIPWRPKACPTATRPTCGWVCLDHWPGAHPGRPKGSTRRCACVYIGHLRRARPGRHPPKHAQKQFFCFITAKSVTFRKYLF